MLINLLLLLIGKSTDTQTIFGNGNINSYSSKSSTGVMDSGTMNNKGLFWGNKDEISGVKVFGLEHWWGNQYRAIAGLIGYSGIQKVKMTYGMSDGSTVDGYNFDGDGYIEVENSNISGTSGGYISKLLFNKNCILPLIVSGSSTTYYCDGIFFNNSAITYPIVGGASWTKYGLSGALYLECIDPPSTYYWSLCACVSCKPLAITE